jgi:hypothetical protein
MKVLRTLAYAAIILAALLILTSLVKAEGFTTVLRVIGFGAYFPFALTAAAVITNQRGVLIATAVIVVLSMVPCTMPELARAVAPIGIGMLVGMAAQHAIRELREEPPHE